MITLRTKKKSRQTHLALELLDLRLAPATVPMAAVLAAEVRVETRHVQRLETSLASAVPGSAHEKSLIHRIAAEQRLMGRQVARLAQLDAPATVVVPASNFTSTQPTPPVVTSQSPLAGAPAAPPVVTTTSPASMIPPPANAITTAPASVSIGIGSSSQTSAAATGSTSSLPPNVSQTLDVIYNAYTQSPSSFPGTLPTTNGANLVVVQGSDVGIQVHEGNPAAFASLFTALTNDGMQVTISNIQSGTIVGLLPIAQLPAVASLPQAPSIMPEMNPTLK
jgi:hypothetical protein